LFEQRFGQWLIVIVCKFKQQRVKLFHPKARPCDNQTKEKDKTRSCGSRGGAEMFLMGQQPSEEKHDTEDTQSSQPIYYVHQEAS
jgi:hypothetical protein